MAGDRRLRQQAAQLEQASLDVQTTLTELRQRQQELLGRIAEAGIRSVHPPPDGTRWKTLDEYRAEFTDSVTTPGRRQQIIAIRCNLLPPETVNVP